MRGIRRVWVMVVVAGLAGCSPGASAPGGTAAAGRAGETAKPAVVKADCTKATKVAIVANGSGYAFSPDGLTIKRGAFLAVTNKSGSAHPLSSTPDAGIVTSVIGLKERQVIQFPRAGAFTVGTGGATLRLKVSGESGCGAPEPSLTITAAGTFEPATARVVATENFAVVNESAGAQSVSCTPGADKDHTRLDAGETEILAIDEPGRYTCASRQHPGTKVTITVTP